MTLKPGTLLKERYRILSVLGQGGMGAVYRAMDEVLNVSVAVKENLFLAEEYTRQFQREASILANLRHPNLPRVGDYCSIAGQGQYLIMDYIEGEDLRQRLARLKTLPENEVILVGVMICEALSYLHSRQPSVIHRDIKPGNIKITPEGDVFLVDFGLAKSAEDPHQATITGARAMTPGYSPPEQYGTARTDARTDIYSLGATLYAALTGEIPEDGLARITGKATLTSILHWRPNMNQQLASVIERALAVDTDDRYQNADDFKKALVEAGEVEYFFQDRPTLTPPPMKSNKQNGFTFGKDKNENGEFVHDLVYGMKNKMQNPSRQIWWMGILIVILSLLVGVGLWGPGHPLENVLGLNKTPTELSVASEKPTSTENLKTPTSSQTKMPAPSQTPTLKVVTSTVKADILPSSTPTSTATPTAEMKQTVVGGDSYIAFVSDRSGMEQIWIMAPDGSQQREVTNMDYGACQPSFSPDTQRIVFISPCSGKQDFYERTQLHFVNIDGSDVMLVPVPYEPEGDFDPAWSPDGKSIAFTSLRTGVYHIFLFDLENLVLHELSSTLYSDQYPVWSQDGTQIAFTHTKLNSVIWTMDNTGNFQTQYSRSGNVNNYSPAWSPDGSIIIYSQFHPEVNGYPYLAGLYYEERGTSNEFRIQPTGLDASYPVSSASFSPDGKWIVFESWPDGRNHDIYMMDIEGTQLKRITTDLAFDFDPTWSNTIPQP